MELRPYQKRCVDFIIERDRGFVIAPAGSGKTIIAASAVAALAKPGSKVGWIANTREQLEQGAEAVSRIEGPAGVEVSFCCAAARPDFSDCDLLVVDESHHLIAETWYAAANTAGGKIFGFSATPWNSSNPERDEALKEFFGGMENFIEIFQEEVRGSGHLAEGAVIFHDIDKQGEFDDEIAAAAEPEIRSRTKRFRRIPEFEHRRRVLWEVTQRTVQANNARNSTARFLAAYHAQQGQSVLILVASIEHGMALQALLPDSVMVSSKMAGGVKARRLAIGQFKSGERRIMIATSLADEGLDCPIASVLILLSGGRSAGKIIQRAGRVMRPYKGKERGLVHDFVDRGACFAYAQHRAREKVYRDLGYSVEKKRP